MAKRPTSPSKTGDPAAPPKPRRARAAATAGKTKTPPAVQEPSLEDIRRRAYERYVERGGKDGWHFDDWIEAEKELRSQNSELRTRKSEI
jgi:hypothetical protein